jgi:hypothetical protein
MYITTLSHPALVKRALSLQLAHQPEYHLGWRDHDQIYMAWRVFGEMFFNDSSAVRWGFQAWGLVFRLDA